MSKTLEKSPQLLVHVSIEKVIGKNKVLSDFLHQCKGGYHVFNNRDKKPAQVHELLKKINTMVEINGGSYYTNEMFQKAEKAVEKKTNELLKDDPQRDRDDARTEAKEHEARSVKNVLILLGAYARGVLAGPIGAAAGMGLVADAVKKENCVIQ